MIHPFIDENGIEHNPSMIEVLGYLTKAAQEKKGAVGDVTHQDKKTLPKTW